MGGIRTQIKMKTSTKIKSFIIILIAITVVITAGILLVFILKKFSVRPAPGVIAKQVEKSQFYKSIETFSTAIAQNSKTYRIKRSDCW